MLNHISVIWGGFCARPGLANRAAGEGGTRTPDAHSQASVHTTHTVCPSTMPLGTMHNYGKAVAIRQSACFSLKQMLQTC